MRRNGATTPEDRVVLESYEGDLVASFEPRWTAAEELPPYKALLDVVRTSDPLLDDETSALLAVFLAMHFHRGESIIQSGIELFEKLGQDKFFFLKLLSDAAADADHLERLATRIVAGTWTVYRSREDELPLGDHALLQRSHNQLIALSPRLLLEIDLSGTAFGRRVFERIPRSKLREYRRRCIASASKEIIFHDAGVLEAWRVTAEYRKRHRLLQSDVAHVQELEIPGVGRVLKAKARDGALSLADVRRPPRREQPLIVSPPIDD